MRRRERSEAEAARRDPWVALARGYAAAAVVKALEQHAAQAMLMTLPPNAASRGPAAS